MVHLTAVGSVCLWDFPLYSIAVKVTIPFETLTGWIAHLVLGHTVHCNLLDSGRLTGRNSREMRRLQVRREGGFLLSCQTGSGHFPSSWQESRHQGKAYWPLLPSCASTRIPPYGLPEVSVTAHGKVPSFFILPLPQVVPPIHSCQS